MALFGVSPELAEMLGWPAGLALLLAGFALLWTVNRYVYPVCPACTAGHDHGHCAVTLHGFAMPLVVAAVLHSFMDGLAIGAANDGGNGRLGWGVFLAIAIHKIPEGLAYGTILRAALKSRLSALGWCVIAQAPTVVGAAVECLAAENLGEGWLIAPLCLAGGSFLFLGYHAIHGEWKKRGLPQSLSPAAAGTVVAAALTHGLEIILR
jgi:zinc transporter ZupT